MSDAKKLVNGSKPMGLACVLAIGVILSCSEAGDDAGTPADTLTRRERDSVIGESRLPGARGVRGATRIADSANARMRRLDSISGSR